MAQAFRIFNPVTVESIGTIATYKADEVGYDDKTLNNFICSAISDFNRTFGTIIPSPNVPNQLDQIWITTNPNLLLKPSSADWTDAEYEYYLHMEALNTSILTDYLSNRVVYYIKLNDDDEQRAIDWEEAANATVPHIQDLKQYFNPYLVLGSIGFTHERNANINVGYGNMKTNDSTGSTKGKINIRQNKWGVKYGLK